MPIISVNSSRDVGHKYYLASVSFLSFSGLLSMHWIAEAATLSQALSQYGHLVQWWMTVELKVLSHLTLTFPTVPTSSFYVRLSHISYMLSHNHNLSKWVLIHSVHTSLKFLLLFKHY